MNKRTIIERLKHMEKGHKDNGMMYEAEVCYRAADRIEEMESEIAVSHVQINGLKEQRKKLQKQVEKLESDFMQYRKGVIKIRGSEGMDHAICLHLSIPPLKEAAIKGDDDGV